ncbi:unnamed protein product [Prorocentrum cordatum]|uniref:Uncharacterized protein n=1 Tax=Prorocentrum cordatum TaxID=2364126 RepID=A0ABN9Y9R1_9DINO|nr:unnamed protein product [Polarella glacialis]
MLSLDSTMLLPCVLEHICADAPAERQPLGRTFDVRARRRARGGPRARFLSEVSDVPARVVGVVLFDSTAKTKYAGKHGPLLCSQHGARSRDADSLHEEPKKIWTQTCDVLTFSGRHVASHRRGCSARPSALLPGSSRQSALALRALRGCGGTARGGGCGRGRGGRGRGRRGGRGGGRARRDTTHG